MSIISLVAAVDENWLIGDHDRMPWHLPAELQHFRDITLGKPVIMGRKTFEAIGSPLEKRQNIILTENTNYHPDGCLTAVSGEAALELVEPAEEIMVAGGRSLYQQFLDHAERIYLSKIHAEFDGDTYFPEIDETDWQITRLKHHEADRQNRWAFTAYLYEREH